MRTKRLKYLAFLLAVTISTSISAQLKNTQWWGNYTYNQSVKEHWQLSARLEIRYLNIGRNFYRSGISPKIQYQTKNNFKYTLGSRFFYYDTEDRDGIMEYRPWLGIHYSSARSQAISLSHQVKWEHRLWGQGISIYESRIRYRFKVGTTLYNKDDRKLKIAFSPELFWSFGEWDQVTYKNTRWGIPVSYQYNSKLVMEIVPFLQTNHNSMLSILDDNFGVIQLNLKTFL